MNTDDVLLAHIQARINTLKLQFTSPYRKDLERDSRLNELELMLNVLSAANRLAMLAVEPEVKE